MLDKELPNRKHPRLSNYDYSAPGAYFITVCTHNRRCILSNVVEQNELPSAETEPVGRGLAPAAKAAPTIQYKPCGTIAKKHLLSIEKRFPFAQISEYVIMPNHIHFILLLHPETAGASPRPTVTETAGASPCPTVMETAGASPRPTVMDIVCTFKSLTTRECKAQLQVKEKLFQISFYEHIIRNKDDYLETVKYIRENPLSWYYDELYAKE